MAGTRDLWTSAYAPAKLSEIAGNGEPVATLTAWATDVQRGKTVKPLLVWGPPGVGKTAAVRAMAKDAGWELVESGANDARDKESVARWFGGGASGLYGKKRLVFFDEVDAIVDRGEIKALAESIKAGGAPVVIGANDYWDAKMADVRSLCLPVEFKAVNLTALKKTANAILQKVGVNPAEPMVQERVTQIANESGGDVRALVIDLQAAFADGKLSPGWPSARERQKSVFRVVGKILKATTSKEALEAADESSEDLDTLLSWLEENAPVEYSQADAAKAYDYLARAGRFSSLAMGRRHYALLRYARFVGLAGVALAKSKPSHAFVSYKFPSWIRKMGQSRIQRGLMDAASLKAGRKLHTSKRRARQSDIPALGKLPGASAYFEWTEDETEAVTGK
jgi:replication factor C large subunit